MDARWRTPQVTVPSNAAERVSVQEALELYTINAARIAFEEHDKGSLEAGKLGDFVVLAEDLFEIDPSHIKDIPVEITVIGGKIVYPGVSAAGKEVVQGTS